VDAAELACGWWDTLAARCLRGDRVRPARGLRRRLALWPVTQVLHAGALLTPLRADARHGAQVDAVVRALDWYRSGEAWGPRRGERPRYADDVAWVGLALAALAASREQPLPDDVRRALAFAMSCEAPEGGVRWHEDAATRHTCATAPAAHLAMLVHRATSDPAALAFARRSMAWLDEVLRRDDGRYGDHANGAPDLTTWAYNQGEPAVAWDLLAAEGDASAGPARDRTVEAAVGWLARPEVLWEQPQVFLGIAVRCLAPLDRSGALRAAVHAHVARVAGGGLAEDGFPADDRAGRYGDDVAIDLAGLIQMAAAVAGPVVAPR